MDAKSDSSSGSHGPPKGGSWPWIEMGIMMGVVVILLIIGTSLQ
jgi:hypothetical protein